MAGDWIKVEHWTPDKPEVYKMSETLSIDPDAVTGKLLRIWIWADQQTLNGDALSVTRASLDRLAGVTGFAHAMTQCGWLNEIDGGLQFTNFNRHNGQTAKTRALTAKRNSSLRSRRHGSDAASVTQSSRSASPREEKRREEIKENTPTPFLETHTLTTTALPGAAPAEPGVSTKSDSLTVCKTSKARREKPDPIMIPDNLANHPDFAAAWERWQKHRSEIGKRVTPTSRNMLLKKLSQFGPIKAITEIDRAITSGWTGIHEDTGGGTNGKRPHDTRPDCITDASRMHKHF